MEIGLRDYFAGQALAGLLATQDASWNDEIGEPAAMWRRGVTGGCYKLADAMLAARGEPKPEPVAQPPWWLTPGRRLRFGSSKDIDVVLCVDATRGCFLYRMPEGRLVVYRIDDLQHAWPLDDNGNPIPPAPPELDVAPKEAPDATP